MHFQTEHHIHGDPDRVVAVLSDPGFYEHLELPDLSKPEVVAHDTSPHGTTIRLRYEFVGSLDPLARRLLGNQSLAWLQEVNIDPQKRSGSLTFGAERDPKRLHGNATFVLEASENETLRRLDGELVVAVPGIGRMAERRILPGLLRRLDIEAHALSEATARDLK
jgi:hypothetical protein